MLSLIKVAKILGKKVDAHLPITECFIDSRLSVKGGLFFALKGDRVDGHNFLEEVALKGAYGAVVHREYTGPHYGLVLIHVDNVLLSLQHLAKTILKERSTRIIGVTGSVGKTTTREFIASLLKGSFRLSVSPKNYNAQATLPLVILNSAGDENLSIFEMAMTEKGNIANLVKIAPPEIVVMTPICYSHAENFRDIEAIAEAKSEIFTEKTEFSVIHEKAARFRAVQEMCSSEHEIYPLDIGISSPFKESHLTENFIGAYLVAKHLNIPDPIIEERSKRLKPFTSRFERKVIEGITFIDDSYNANPLSMIAALKNLPEVISQEKNKRIAILGSMKELGEFSYISHREVGLEASQYVDELYCIGDEASPMVEVFKGKGKTANLFDSYDALEEKMWERAEKGDVVLLKGSNSHVLWKFLDREKV